MDTETNDPDPREEILREHENELVRLSNRHHQGTISPNELYQAIDELRAETLVKIATVESSQ